METYSTVSLGSRRVPTWKASYSCFQSEQVLLAEGWSVGHPILCHTASPLVCESQQFINRAPETRALPAPRSQWRPRITATRRVIWHRYYTLPVIVCLIVHFFFFPCLADSLWWVIIFSQEALVSQSPLTSLDAAPSCRFPSWPHHKWQTLTKPQVCAESSFLVCVVCAAAVCHVV